MYFSNKSFLFKEASFQLHMESFLYKRYILIFHYGDNSQTGRYNFGSHNKVLCSNLLKSTFNLIYVMYFSSFRTFFIYDYKILLKISEMS
jgi:hypothetical protein